MSLTAGTRLGPYEILSALGAGGMGEVYRARDARLDRTVAIKILPQHVVDHPTRRQLFEREARAASRLSHPHICALYDVGQQDEVHFIVMEYLDGETLADHLHRGALPLHLALRTAIEVADALAHAHHQGIVHCDLKPANVMLTRSGAKLLDFGVARLRGPDDTVASVGASVATKTQPVTQEGTILGTLQYMAPEQLEGGHTDARTDIFALGSVIYEMVTGRPAFEGSSKASLIAAILEHEPQTLSSAGSESTLGRTGPVEPMPPLLVRIVSRCLAKDPNDRWQTATDLREALKWIAEGSQVDAPSHVSTKRRPRERVAWMAAAVSLAIAAASYLVTRSDSQGIQPLAAATFKQLTFKRGWLTEARFAPDGQTVIYAPSWDGQPVQLYETRISGPESRPLGTQGSGLASISSSSELALLLRCRLYRGWCVGTLGRVPVSGGAPREVLEDVAAADFTPDGRDLAVIRVVQGEYRVEYPIGKTLYTTAGWLRGLAFSPQGDRLAFLEHPILSEESGVIKVVDLQGHATTVSSGWRTIKGLDWSPGGEIWFTGSQTGKDCSLYAVSLSGQLRLILHAPGDLTLFDISRDGRLLVSASSSPPRGRMIWADAQGERELSWLDWSTVADMSADGKTVLFHEWGVGVAAVPTVYLRRLDDPAPTRLGNGLALALSPDGRWALTVVEGTRPQLVLLPTGTGQSRQLPTDGLTDVYWAKWFPDGHRLLLVAAEADITPRTYVQDVETGKREAFAEDGTMAMLVSPDGGQILAMNSSGRYDLWPLNGADPIAADGIRSGDLPILWSKADDGRYVYLRGREEDVLAIYRYDLATKRRQLWRRLAPRDPAGVISIAANRGEVAMTPNGQSYAYTYWVILEDLFLVEGVR